MLGVRLLTVLSTLLRKTSGRVRVAGFDVDSDSGEVRKRIGFAMQEVGVDDLSTGWDFLVLQGVLYGQSPRSSRARAGELLELVGLTSVADRRIATYSGGMRRRIDLVGALMHRPQVLFLDEPTTGLDPQGRNRVWEQLGIMKSTGVSIVMSTHYMDEAAMLCDRLVIMDRGRVLAEGTPDELIRRHAGPEVGEVRVDEGRRAATAEELRRRGCIVRVVGAVLSVTAGDGRRADLSGLEGARVSYRLADLEDVFLALTGRELRDE